MDRPSYTFTDGKPHKMSDVSTIFFGFNRDMKSPLSKSEFDSSTDFIYIEEPIVNDIKFTPTNIKEQTLSDYYFLRFEIKIPRRPPNETD